MPNLSSFAFVSLLNWIHEISSFLLAIVPILSRMTILRGYILSHLMKNFEFAQKELQKLQDIGKLKWNNEKKRWNKNFYPITDDENKFIKWAFGNWPRSICVYCGKILITVKENPSKRASRYCSDEHSRKHQTIVTRAMKKFNLKKFDIERDNPKTFRNWNISIPSIYENFRDKEGKLRENKIKDRVESKDIKVTINGETFPYTTKSRTI